MTFFNRFNNSYFFGVFEDCLTGFDMFRLKIFKPIQNLSGRIKVGMPVEFTLFLL